MLLKKHVNKISLIYFKLKDIVQYFIESKVQKIKLHVFAPFEDNGTREKSKEIKMNINLLYNQKGVISIHTLILHLNFHVWRNFKVKKSSKVTIFLFKH